MFDTKLISVIFEVFVPGVEGLLTETKVHGLKVLRYDI